jgi:hypothetical protein
MVKISLVPVYQDYGKLFLIKISLYQHISRLIPYLNGFFNYIFDIMVVFSAIVLENKVFLKKIFLVVI